MIITAALMATIALSRQTTCEGITYADSPSSLWIPYSSLRKGLSFEPKVQKSDLIFGDSKVPMRRLVGVDDWVIKLADLKRAGFSLEWDDDEKKAGIWLNDDVIVVYLNPKFVLVSLDDQELRAYQGHFLTLRTHVSTGFDNRTPQGSFTAIAKERMHFSGLFNGVPMPFSVQVTGNIFIHAFPDVPPNPASHGCIRLPYEAAQSLFEWIEIGTEIEIR